MSGQELGDIRTPRQIIRFAIPTIIVMVSISTYSIVDGALISNMLGTDALAALNIVMPVSALFTSFGFMFSTGGSAYVATRLGEGRRDDANRSFSGIVLTAFAVSIASMAVILAFSSQLVDLMGADDTLHDLSFEYLVVYGAFAPTFILQFLTTQFLIVAGRPGLSLASSLAAGMVNITLDILFMGPFGMGMAGAALASGIGALMAVAVGAFYFLLRKDSPIRFVRPSLDPAMLGKTCSNGASEMVTELSGSVTTLLFNLTMMKYYGPDGVSAITILMYVQFLSLAITLGYSMGVAPVMSYDHGAGDKGMMRNLFSVSLRFVGILSIIVFVLLEILAGPIVGLFAGDSEHVREMAVHGARIFAFAFLLMEFNAYASSLFTSLSNGLLSALISFIRGLLVLAPLIVLIPMAIGAEGVWYAVPLTEIVSFAISSYLVVRMGPKYGYLNGRERTDTGSARCRSPKFDVRNRYYISIDTISISDKMSIETDPTGLNPEAYAERIGAEWPVKADLDTLDELIWRNQCSVPFENIQSFDDGTVPSMELKDIYGKVVLKHRGGYCFELNKIFKWFLGECGFNVRPITCCVLCGKGFVPSMLHRATLVELDGETYYCDVGFGGPQPPFAVPLGGDRKVHGERFISVKGDGPWWYIDRYNSSGELERVMGFWDFEVSEQYYEPLNYFCGAYPESPFVAMRLLNLRLPDGSLALMNSTLTEHREGKVTKTVYRNEEEVSAAIRDLFGFDVPAGSLKHCGERLRGFLNGPDVLG